MNTYIHDWEKIIQKFLRIKQNSHSYQSNSTNFFLGLYRKLVASESEFEVISFNTIVFSVTWWAGNKSQITMQLAWHSHNLQIFMFNCIKIPITSYRVTLVINQKIVCKNLQTINCTRTYTTINHFKEINVRAGKLSFHSLAECFLYGIYE